MPYSPVHFGMKNRGSAAAALVLAVLAFLLLAACGRTSEPEEDSGVLDVFVTIKPMAYFAERIGGEAVNVVTLVPPGSDPHIFEPTSKTMVAMAEADVYFAVGLDLEESFLGVLEANLPNLTVVNTSEGLEAIAFGGHEGEHEGEEAGAENGHEHKGLDPHIWMGPRHALGLAANMRDAFIAARPEEADLFRANYNDFAASVEALDAEIRPLLEPFAGRPLMAAHPSFGYFAAEYGLRQIAVEVDGKDPSPRQLDAMIAEALEEGAGIILVQPQFSAESAALLAEAIDGAVVEADPLAADWEEGIRSLAIAVADGLR